MFTAISIVFCVVVVFLVWTTVAILLSIGGQNTIPRRINATRSVQKQTKHIARRQLWTKNTHWLKNGPGGENKWLQRRWAIWLVWMLQLTEGEVWDLIHDPFIETLNLLYLQSTSIYCSLMTPMIHLVEALQPCATKSRDAYNSHNAFIHTVRCSSILFTAVWSLDRRALRLNVCTNPDPSRFYTGSLYSFRKSAKMQ